jgi:hypothetical protein
MKKTLPNFLLASFGLFTSLSVAQTSLTATGINPLIGETYTLKSGAYVSPGNAGASQTWDLSSMSGTSAGLTTIVTPSSTPNGSSFSSANVCASNPTANTYNYYITSSSALKNAGIYGNGTSIVYSNTEDFLHFPFAYANTYTDSWAASFLSSGYTWYRKGSTAVTADGYGTLITPTQTYSNVMRVHFVQTYKDSTYVGMPYVINYTNDEYMWYKNGIHTQITAVYTLSSDAGGGPYTGAIYVATPNVGVNDASDFISSSSLFPNPAADQVTVDFTLTENKSVSLQIFNTVGQQVVVNENAEGFQGLNSIQLDVTKLPEGIYFAQVILDGSIATTKRFVVTK